MSTVYADLIAVEQPKPYGGLTTSCTSEGEYYDFDVQYVMEGQAYPATPTSPEVRPMPRILECRAKVSLSIRQDTFGHVLGRNLHARDDGELVEFSVLPVSVQEQIYEEINMQEQGL